MKICHVNYHALSGGGAVAARRLHQALKHLGTNSNFLSIDTEGCPDAIPLCSDWVKQKLRWKQRILWRLYQLQHSSNRSAHAFDIMPSGLVPKILKLKPDIVHLHVVNGEMFSIREIAELCGQTHVVWTLHDCWPFCGTEQHPLPGGNDRYKNGYTRQNREDRGVDFDRYVWTRKCKYWQNLPCSFIAPSHWIAGMAAESELLRHASVTTIPHGINLNDFSPAEKETAKNNLGIPPSEFVIGFAASELHTATKGGNILLELLTKSTITNLPTIKLVTCGSGKFPEQIGNIKIVNLGSRSATQMPDFYRSLDLFVNPSKLESFGLTNLEAMACGCPVLAFNATGVSEVVKHKVSGYLAQDQNDLQKGLDWILAQDNTALANNARLWVETNFSSIVWAKRHIEIYHSILNA